MPERFIITSSLSSWQFGRHSSRLPKGYGPPTPATPSAPGRPLRAAPGLPLLALPRSRPPSRRARRRRLRARQRLSEYVLTSPLPPVPPSRPPVFPSCHAGASSAASLSSTDPRGPTAAPPDTGLEGARAGPEGSVAGLIFRQIRVWLAEASRF